MMQVQSRIVDELLLGAVDCHVHSYPDVIARSTNDLSLVQQARDNGVGGLVLKCHHGSTVERAWLLGEIQDDVEVRGGLVLNHHAGGFNPHAVEAALQLGATQIWMPTKSAANHRVHLGGSGDLQAVEAGRLKPPLIDILRLIAAADAVLATGHLSPQESEALVAEALSIGVTRISVTHPEWGVTAMPIDIQKKFAATSRVFFERCLVSVQDDIPLRVEFAEIVQQIRTVGSDTTIAATDFGMPQYSPPVTGLRT